MNLVVFSAIACAFLLGMLLLSLSLSAAAAIRWLYLPVFCVLLAIFVAACLVKDPDSRLLPALIYGFVVTLFLFGICLGTVASPDKQAVTFVVLLLTVPLLFTDRPIWMILSIGAAVIAFVITAVCVKEKAMLVTDIVDVLVFGMVSAIVCTYMMRVKCQRFLYAQKVATLSETDLLTGLRNRNSYEQRLKAASAAKDGLWSCVYVDVNGLHELNNTKGHDAGDEMLRAVGSALQAEFGKENVFRIGGDEFVVLLPGAEEQAAREKVGGIKRTLAARYYHVSVGCVQGNLAEIALSQLIRQAEEEMYREKRAFYRETANDRRGRR